MFGNRSPGATIRFQIALRSHCSRKASTSSLYRTGRPVPRE